MEHCFFGVPEVLGGLKQGLEFRPVPPGTGGTYRFARLPVRGPPATGSYTGTEYIGTPVWTGKLNLGLKQGFPYRPVPPCTDGIYRSNGLPVRGPPYTGRYELQTL
ncbi:hypothetical protein GW17_00014473 [Ensete ventricosum]|nr:hypothetical protein GW17_00014473 [Ensete ventricosum]